VVSNSCQNKHAASVAAEMSLIKRLVPSCRLSLNTNNLQRALTMVRQSSVCNPARLGHPRTCILNRNCRCTTLAHRHPVSLSGSALSGPAREGVLLKTKLVMDSEKGVTDIYYCMGTWNMACSLAALEPPVRLTSRRARSGPSHETEASERGVFDFSTSSAQPQS
jgi:hypothetical protein